MKPFLPLWQLALEKELLQVLYNLRIIIQATYYSVLLQELPVFQELWFLPGLLKVPFCCLGGWSLHFSVSQPLLVPANGYMGLRGLDWCVGIQKAEAGSIWLEPNHNKKDCCVSLGLVVKPSQC